MLRSRERSLICLSFFFCSVVSFASRMSQFTCCCSLSIHLNHIHETPPILLIKKISLLCHDRSTEFLLASLFVLSRGEGSKEEMRDKTARAAARNERKKFCSEPWEWDWNCLLFVAKCIFFEFLWSIFCLLLQINLFWKNFFQRKTFYSGDRCGGQFRETSGICDRGENQIYHFYALFGMPMASPEKSLLIAPASSSESNSTEKPPKRIWSCQSTFHNFEEYSWKIITSQKSFQNLFLRFQLLKLFQFNSSMT